MCLAQFPQRLQIGAVTSAHQRSGIREAEIGCGSARHLGSELRVHLRRGLHQRVQGSLPPDHLGGGGDHPRGGMAGPQCGGRIDDGDFGTEAAQIPSRGQADDPGADDNDVQSFSLRRHDPHQV